MMPLQVTQPPVLTEGGVTTRPPIADRFATVRTKPSTGRLDYLGVVGTRYEPARNEESCTLLDASPRAVAGQGLCHFPRATTFVGFMDNR